MCFGSHLDVSSKSRTGEENERHRTVKVDEKDVVCLGEAHGVQMGAARHSVRGRLSYHRGEVDFALGNRETMR